MSLAFRYYSSLLSMACLLALYIVATIFMPRAGDYRGPYGDILNAIAPEERHATDIVTAITFDYRGLDTLGEELILFASVIGVAVMLRRHRDEREATVKETERPFAIRPVSNASDAVRLLTAALIGPSVTFGLYIVAHGQISPGGGFQGGTILASVPLIVYLAATPERYLRIAPTHLVERAEAAGVLAFIVIGLIGFFATGIFLDNIFPLGPMPPNISSSGMIFLLNLATGLEVSGGFVFLLTAFAAEGLRHRLAR